MEKSFFKKPLIAFAGWSIITIILGITTVLSAAFLYLNPTLPDIDSLRDIELQTPLRVFSADGQLIGEFGEKRRDPIRYEEAPTHLLDAILAAEDDGFYSHNGVDIAGLVRAASQLVISGAIQSGGSTITMQVARNFFLNRNQTFSRKFNEILLALKIEQELSKKEILELYLNKIYLGNRAYGVKAAAQVYYGQPIQELSLAQIAMISGLPKAPSTYNPIINPSRALIRRDWILGRMLSLGKITADEHKAAIAEPVTAIYHGQHLDLNAPYVAEMAREKAIKLLGEEAYTGGYSVITTIDSRLQAAGQTAIIKGLLDYDRRHGYRGPETQFSLDTLQALEANDDNPTAINIGNTQLGAVNLLPWTQRLNTIPTYGTLKPAAVINVEKRNITAILGSGKAITIHWENGLKQAGRHVNENYTKPPPKTAAKIVKLGDVIRVYEARNQTGENTWHFAQIPKIQSALVAIDPLNGGIRTIVGGFDFKQSSFNRASQAKRLPGSNFKPFIYSIALDNGLTAASVFNDAPIVVEDAYLESTWRPENASGKFYGPTRLRKALYLSRNLVSIRILRNLGIDKAIQGLEHFGIDSGSVHRDLSMVLGTYVMTPLEVATAYSVFANNGYKVEPFLVEKIIDRQGNSVFVETPFVVDPDKRPNTGSQNTTSQIIPSLQTPEDPSLLTVPNTQKSNVKKAPRVMDKRTAYIMNSMLRDVIHRGTAKKAQQLQRKDLGGKTGTTNGPTDAWFSGFNQHLVATAWVGFDNNNKIGRREYGGTAALPIWIDFMKAALQDIPEALPPRPNGIVTVRIDPETGKPTSPDNPNGINEIFLSENAPSPNPEDSQDAADDSVVIEDLF